MHILKTILSLILIFIIALIFIGIVLPSNNEPIKATIDSDPYINACVFNQINDLNKWDNWSVWHHKDPQMTKKYDSTTVGLGAHYSWKGNYKVGEGEIYITKSIANKEIELTMYFGSEKDKNTSIISFDEQEIAWTMPIKPIENPVFRFFLGGYQYIFMKFFVYEDFNTNLKNLTSNCK
jgi:hypothetical protein